MICKTVRVVSPPSDSNPLGYIVINEDDLTGDHELFDPAPKAADKPPKAPTKEAQPDPAQTEK